MRWRQIEEGSAEFAVLPIENSSAGPVNEMYDLLDEFENYIVAETILPGCSYSFRASGNKVKRD